MLNYDILVLNSAGQHQFRGKVLLQHYQEMRQQRPPRPVAFLMGLHPPTLKPLSRLSIAECESTVQPPGPEGGPELLEFYDHFDTITSTMSGAMGPSGENGPSLVESFDCAVVVACEYIGNAVGDSPLQLLPADGTTANSGTLGEAALLLGKEEKISKTRDESGWLCIGSGTNGISITKDANMAGVSRPTRIVASAEKIAGTESVVASKTMKNPLQAGNVENGKEVYDPEVEGIKHDDSWRDVWRNMLRAGWTWEGDDIEGYWIKPGCKVQDGRDRVDYFSSEKDVRIFAENHYGWSDPARTVRRRRVLNKKVGNSGKWVSFSPQEVGWTEGDMKTPSPTDKQQRARKNKVPPKNLRSPILPEDDWAMVWEKMRRSGWDWKSGRGIVSYYYIKPGGKGIKCGVEGTDYFTSEDQVQAYATEHFGWKESGGMVTSTRGRGKRQQQGRGDKIPVKKKSKVSSKRVTMSPMAIGIARAGVIRERLDETEKSQISDKMIHSSGKAEEYIPEVTCTPIRRNEEWAIVWEKLLYSGWRWQKGSGLIDYFYIKPGKNAIGGTEGMDYFVAEEDVRAFVEEKYGWHDPERQDSTIIQEGTRAAKTRLKPANPTSQKRKSKSESKKPAVRRKIMSPVNSTVQEASVVLKNKLIRKQSRDAKKKENKTAKKSSKKALKLKRSSPPDRIWGAVSTAKKYKVHEGCTPVGQSTKPKDPGLPLLSTGSDKTASSLSSVDSEIYYYFPNLWKRLKKTGWKVVKATKSNPLQDWYWCRPNRNPHSPETQLGVDYFDSPEQVVAYQKKMDEKDRKVKMSKDDPKNQGLKKQDTSTSPNPKSAVTNEFDKEAVAFESSSVTVREGSPRKQYVWWKADAFPRFSKVWKTLKDLGFRYTSVYYLPGGRTRKNNGIINEDYFESSDAMRRHLCCVGVPNLYSVETSLNRDEQDMIERWASTAHVPGINEHNSLSVLASIPILTFDEVWRLLEDKLGYYQNDGRFYVPGKNGQGVHSNLSHERDYFNDISELRCFLRTTGLYYQTDNSARGTGRTGALTDEEHISVALWASLSPLPSYERKDEKSLFTERPTETEREQKAQMHTPLDECIGPIPAVITANTKNRLSRSTTDRQDKFTPPSFQTTIDAETLQ